MMVRPIRFGFNEETAGSNAFQQRSASDAAAIQTAQQAVGEFDDYVTLLRQNGIGVDVVQDTPVPATPDSIFPNNCFSTHRNHTEHTLVLYPMAADNRQQERQKLLLHPALHPECFTRIIDLTHWEKQQKYLEGTGSLVLDREHRVAYACRSPRTHEDVLRDWAKQLGYSYILFDSEDEGGTPVYHTNVIMHVGTHYAVVCLESVKNDTQRHHLINSLEQNGKQIVPISFGQMHAFAGNMLELRNYEGEKLLIMSRTAYLSLTEEQKALLEQDVRIIAPDIQSIETAGGGSARCMIAEMY